MPILLSDILQSDQRKAVGVASGLFVGRRTTDAIANTKFYDADHWQNGNGWIGAKPLTGPASLATLLQIKEGFVSENVVKEVVDRHVSGILGRVPLWGFVPQATVSPSTLTRRRRFAKLFRFLLNSTDEAAEADPRAQEADEALTVWWDNYQIHQQLKEALALCLSEERVLLRFFVPRGLYGRDGVVPVKSDLTSALSLLHLHVATSDQGGVFTDSETQQKFALYVYQVDGEKCVDLSYVDDLGQTIFQVLSDKAELAVKPIAYDLQGRLWMHELTRSPLITEQFRAAQKALNLDLTMLMRNVNLAGNLERTIMNAEPPKRKVRVPDDSAQGYHEETIDSEFLIGPGVSNLLSGLLVKNEKGEIIGRANPNISYRDPVPITTFVGTRAELRECMLGQAQQLHIMISGDSTVSGRSREQARAEFRGSLQDSKEPLDDSGRWLLETPLRIGAQFCNRTAEFAGLRCDFDSRVEDGPVSSEDRAANRADVAAGLLDKETAMSRNGVEDTDATKQRIAEDRAEAPAPVMPPPVPKPLNGDSQLVQ